MKRGGNVHYIKEKLPEGLIILLIAINILLFFVPNIQSYDGSEDALSVNCSSCIDCSAALGNSTWLVTETCSDVCKAGKCESVFFQSAEFYIILITIVAGAIVIVAILLIPKLKKKIYKPYSKL